MHTHTLTHTSRNSPGKPTAQELLDFEKSKARSDRIKEIMERNRQLTLHTNGYSFSSMTGGSRPAARPGLRYGRMARSATAEVIAKMNVSGSQRSLSDYGLNHALADTHEGVVVRRRSPKFDVLIVGDIIDKVQTSNIKTRGDVLQALSTTPSGARISMVVIRARQRIRVSCVLK